MSRTHTLSIRTVRLGRSVLFAMVACSCASESRAPAHPPQPSAAAGVSPPAPSSDATITTPVATDAMQPPSSPPPAAGDAGSATIGQAGTQVSPMAGASAIAGASAMAGASAAMIDAGAAGSPQPGGGPREAPPASTCAPTTMLRPGDTNDSLDVGGVRRSYIVHVPMAHTGATPVPLLIDMHGLFGNGSGQLRGSGTKAVADREGFVAVYPDGIDNAWNVGPCCTHDRNVDDVGFMRALVDKLQTQACIDRSRVYATGVSMGGGMSHYLACEAADTFAAVAPAAFDLLEENDCIPARPIAVLSARGTADAIVPFSGGASTPPNGVPTTIHFRGAKGTFEEWARINGCSGMPSSSYDTCESYTQCKGGVEVTLCTEQAGRHTYGDPERAWKMLSKYRLP